VSIRVDVTSPVPPFEQVRAQVVQAVESGQLAPGTQLPSVRQLARDLGLAPGTVAKAYAQLEAAGITTASRRHGTRIAPGAAIPPEERVQRLRELARDYAAAANRWQITSDIARRTVLQALDNTT
jgi:DNA-binding transcriptional regulator YhcF (GntR family)